MKQTINLGSPNQGDGDTLRDGGDKINDNFDEVYQGVQLDTVVTPPTHQPGRYWFDGSTFNFYDNIEETSIQLGKELLIDVHNDSGVTIPNLSVVRYGGLVAGVPVAILAQADTVANASGVAVLTHDLLDGEDGKATFTGLVGGDTSMWSAGDPLFLSATVPGELTNIEQPILNRIGRVYVSDAVNGVIIVSPSGVINIVALGQVGGNGRTQAITTTPAPITAYENTYNFEKNVSITNIGATNLRAQMSPASVGASGYYRIVFEVALTSTDNDLLTFTIYINGAPTSVSTIVDLRNNNIDAGSGSINAITDVVILDTDVIEVYANNDGGTSDVTFTSATNNIERIGNS